MSFVEIQDLVKTFRTKFGAVTAVDHVSMEIKRGELITLLGPSGCGKTTTLRCIAGLERPDDGDVIIDGRSMFRKGFVPPSQRNIGMVFQNYAVWPHMTVAANVAYGLKLEGIPRQARTQRVHEILALVGLAGLERRYPAQLSGGQQQRVALARALVRQPKVLLLDEPLSNLDAKLRERMRFEIRRIVKQLQITAVYVTHDQAEAMVLSDRIAIMESGKIIQVGSPAEIYQRPATRFVADFIGMTNILEGQVEQVDKERGLALVITGIGRTLCKLHNPTSIPTNANVYLSVRPEDIEVLIDDTSPRANIYKGKVTERAYLGHLLYLFLAIGDVQIRVQCHPRLQVEEGQEVRIYLDPERCVVLTA